MSRVLPSTWVVLGLAFLGGCGDRCDRLCNLIEIRRAECGSVPADWARTCRSDWRDSAAALTAREQDLALEVCADTRVAVAEWSCEALQAQYDTGVSR